MSKVDEALRRHYRGQELGDDRLERLLAAARAGESPRAARADPPPLAAMPGDDRPGPSRRAVGGWLAAAAALLLVALGAAFLLPPGSSGLTAQVVDEVVKNHRKGSPVTIHSDRYEIVQAELDRLGFSILPTRGRLLRSFELEGGRYCSLRKVTAAQLSVRRADDGSRCTLYVAPATGELRGVGPGVATRGDVRVELWIDDGRLFALAGPVDSGC